jgi:hypothetical protein
MPGCIRRWASDAGAGIAEPVRRERTVVLVVQYAVAVDVEVAGVRSSVEVEIDRGRSGRPRRLEVEQLDGRGVAGDRIRPGRDAERLLPGSAWLAPAASAGSRTPQPSAPRRADRDLRPEASKSVNAICSRKRSCRARTAPQLSSEKA